MADVKVPASGNIRVWFALSNAFADYKNPTAAEINASLDLSDAVSWNDFDFNLEASNQLEDPAITSIGKIVDRGYTNWGGSISFYYPRTFDDSTSKYSEVYDALDAPRTNGYLVLRIDGEESAATVSAGDMVHCFKVVTDGYAESITGEEAFRYTVTFLPQGDYVVRAIAAGVSPNAVDVTPATLSTAAGDHDELAVTFGGRVYTNGVEYSSSNNAVATVSRAGIVTSVATGTATITATGPNGQTDTCVVTVS
jgi:hypothetical protein